MPDLMTVAGIAVKTSLLIVVAGLLAIALRRQSAAFQHVLWTAVLALCVLMPFAAAWLPTHTVVTLPPPAPSPASGGGLGWGLWLCIWLVGCASILLRQLFASIGLARWRRDARPLTSSRWATTLARISAAEDFGARRIRVLESPHIASPCTWGVLRPVVLLPMAGDAWPESARSSALLHELAHVRRHDALTALIARLACALHWYNPLVWLAAAQVRHLQERACDDAVLHAGAMPSEYAQFLLDVAERVSGSNAPTRTAIGMTHSSLHTRIVAILDVQATRSPPRRANVIVACMSLLSLGVLVATASVAIEAPSPPPSPTLPTAAIPAVAPVPAVAAVPAVPAVPPSPPPVPPTPPVESVP